MSTTACQHDCTCFSKSISKTITNYFTTAFTCLGPSIPGAQEIDNALPDVFAILCRVSGSQRSDGTQEKSGDCELINYVHKKEEIYEVCLAKSKKSLWAFFFFFFFAEKKILFRSKGNKGNAVS